jgi:death on curing protein
VEDVIRLHAFELSMQRPVPQQRLQIASKLESALNRPMNARFYEGSDLPRQAAHLLWGITKAHAFIDGNKRTAWIATQYFLDLHGFLIDQDYQGAFPVVIGVAENQ